MVKFWVVYTLNACLGLSYGSSEPNFVIKLKRGLTLMASENSLGGREVNLQRKNERFYDHIW